MHGVGLPRGVSGLWALETLSQGEITLGIWVTDTRRGPIQTLGAPRSESARLKNQRRRLRRRVSPVNLGKKLLRKRKRGASAQGEHSGIKRNKP